MKILYAWAGHEQGGHASAQVAGLQRQGSAVQHRPGARVLPHPPRFLRAPSRSPDDRPYRPRQECGTHLSPCVCVHVLFVCVCMCVRVCVSTRRRDGSYVYSSRMQMCGMAESCGCNDSFISVLALMRGQDESLRYMVAKMHRMP